MFPSLAVVSMVQREPTNAEPVHPPASARSRRHKPGADPPIYRREHDDRADDVGDGRQQVPHDRSHDSRGGRGRRRNPACKRAARMAVEEAPRTGADGAEQVQPDVLGNPDHRPCSQPSTRPPTRTLNCQQAEKQAEQGEHMHLAGVPRLSGFGNRSHGIHQQLQPILRYHRAYRAPCHSRQ
jgi:hypothetical protein